MSLWRDVGEVCGGGTGEGGFAIISLGKFMNLVAAKIRPVFILCCCQCFVSTADSRTSVKHCSVGYGRLSLEGGLASDVEWEVLFCYYYLCDLSVIALRNAWSFPSWFA